jgi:hypothetical protein
VAGDIYTVATQLAILQAGRTPVWSVQPDTGSLLPPAAVSDGVNLQSACRVLAQVTLREDPHHRTARLDTDGTLTGTYTVTIDGNAVAYDATAGAPANEAALVTAIAAAISADGTVGPLVTATAVDADDTTTGALIQVRIRGDGEEDFSIDFVHSAAAVITCVADLCEATMRPWWAMAARPGSTAPVLWSGMGDVYDVDRRGLVERFECAGLSRLFVQLYERGGHAGDHATRVTYNDPVINIGPCLSEVT